MSIDFFIDIQHSGGHFSALFIFLKSISILDISTFTARYSNVPPIEGRYESCKCRIAADHVT